MNRFICQSTLSVFVRLCENSILREVKTILHSHQYRKFYDPMEETL